MNLQLPLGARRKPGAVQPTLVARLDDARAVDLGGAARAGLFEGAVDAEMLTAPTLNPLLACPPTTWDAVRERLVDLVGAGTDTVPTVELAGTSAALPFEVGDYVDFYSSEHHARNVSQIFRPGNPALPAAWRALPIGYHGRAGTVVVSGTPVRRPVGHRADEHGGVLYGPCTQLDIELEVGFVTGGAARTPLDLAAAERLIFGVVLVNDWSARDLQRFEYVPLGPFLGKSFATSVSAWVTPLAALDGYRAPAPAQEPAPLGRLGGAERWLLDLDLQVSIRPAGGDDYVVVSRTSSRELYWTFPQQLVHAASNGSGVRPGDLFASGTVSGPGECARGSLLELTWNGARPLELGGVRRGYLADGDSVLLTAATPDGRVTLGEVEGAVRAVDEEDAS